MLGANFRYQVFTSYSHRDSEQARRIHKYIETYWVDKKFVGRVTKSGLVPRSLRPAFFDRDEFTAGDSLASQTRAALDSSKNLVVICSPDAARSKYVNEEVRYFKSLGRTHNIFPIIISGEPNNLENECFPAALRYNLDEAGNVSSIAADPPLAADMRPDGDGEDYAIQKLVAGLLGLGVDKIVSRMMRRQRLTRRALLAYAIVTTVIAISSTLIAWSTWKLCN